MKIERLLQIVIYLINNGRISGTNLAMRYEVSLRTIQRDIDTLTLAGIPIIAYSGVDGGYEIDKDYKMHLQVASDMDYSNILKSLYAYQSAFESQSDLEETIDKMQSLKRETDDLTMQMDFSIASERPEVNARLELIQDAITRKSCVSFYYVNAKDESSIKYVQPFSLIFKWYAWYLIGFDTIKNEKRMYKLIRMDDLTLNDTKYLIERIFIDNDILQEREYYDIVLYASAHVKTRLMEYINAHVIEEFEEGIVRMEARVAKNDIFWKGILISCGAQIKIVQPLELKEELLGMVSGFYLANYDKHMS